MPRLTKPRVPQLLSPHALEPTLHNRRGSCKAEKEPKFPLEAGLGRSWLSLGNILSSKQSCKFFYCILMMRQTQSDSSEIPKSPSWTVTHRFKLRPACFQRGRKLSHKPSRPFLRLRQARLMHRRQRGARVHSLNRPAKCFSPGLPSAPSASINWNCQPCQHFK